MWFIRISLIFVYMMISIFSDSSFKWCLVMRIKIFNILFIGMIFQMMGCDPSKVDEDMKIQNLKNRIIKVSNVQGDVRFNDRNLRTNDYISEPGTLSAKDDAWVTFEYLDNDVMQLYSGELEISFGNTNSSFSSSLDLEPSEINFNHRKLELVSGLLYVKIPERTQLRMVSYDFFTDEGAWTLYHGAFGVSKTEMMTDLQVGEGSVTVSPKVKGGDLMDKGDQVFMDNLTHLMFDGDTREDVMDLNEELKEILLEKLNTL